MAARKVDDAKDARMARNEGAAVRPGLPTVDLILSSSPTLLVDEVQVARNDSDLAIDLLQATMSKVLDGAVTCPTISPSPGSSSWTSGRCQCSSSSLISQPSSRLI